MIKNYIYNKFLKLRFWFYRNFKHNKLKNYSEINNNRKLLFNDDFNTISWSSEKTNNNWIIGEGFGLYHPNKLRVYYGAPELAQNSCAKFTVKYRPKTFLIEGKIVKIPFEVSLLSTFFSHKQQYGRFECRCTIPHDKGVWPAFWLWGSTWPPEIDIFEFYGGRTGRRAGIQEICAHYGNEIEGNHNIGVKKIRIERKNGLHEFHEFAVEWCKDKIEFYTDGIKIFQYNNKKILDKWFNVDTANMWIIINHSVQERYVDFNEIDYHSEFLVDYIRAYAPITK